MTVEVTNRSGVVAPEGEAPHREIAVVLREIAHDGARQADRLHDAHRIAAHQDHIPRLDRHIGAGAHGNADIGLGERRCIVDTVTDHCDCVATLLKVGDNSYFLIR